jgi:hypothetical protein
MPEQEIETNCPQKHPNIPARFLIAPQIREQSIVVRIQNEPARLNSAF